MGTWININHRFKWQKKQVEQYRSVHFGWNGYWIYKKWTTQTWKSRHYKWRNIHLKLILLDFSRTQQACILLDCWKIVCCWCLFVFAPLFLTMKNSQETKSTDWTVKTQSLKVEISPLWKTFTLKQRSHTFLFAKPANCFHCQNCFVSVQSVDISAKWSFLTSLREKGQSAKCLTLSDFLCFWDRAISI